MVGCSGARGSHPENLFLLTATADHQPLLDTLPSDPDVDTLISPYRNQVIDSMSLVVGRAIAQFDEARPEGALGNLVADAMLYVIQSLVDDSVHLAVTNNGGLRVPLLEGPITVGEIFELAPFENVLIVLEMSGADLQALADDIARVGGEPIAGFTFHIDGATGRAGGVRVGPEPLRNDRTYRVVTLDYLADGGDRLRTLWSVPDRVVTDVVLRDAIIQYIQLRGEIQPKLEDRIIRAAR